MKKNGDTKSSKDMRERESIKKVTEERVGWFGDVEKRCINMGSKIICKNLGGLMVWTIGVF